MWNDLDPVAIRRHMGRSRPGVHYPPPNPALSFADHHPGTLLAMMAFGEARSEGYLGQLLVCLVARNRMDDPRTYLNGGKSSGVASVVLNPWAFSCFNLGDPNRETLKVAPRRESAAWESCREAAFDVLEGRARIDFTDGSTHYHVAKMARPPKWARHPRMVRTVEYRKHRFFREE